MVRQLALDLASNLMKQPKFYDIGNHLRTSLGTISEGGKLAHIHEFSKVLLCYLAVVCELEAGLDKDSSNVKALEKHITRLRDELAKGNINSIVEEVLDVEGMLKVLEAVVGQRLPALEGILQAIKGLIGADETFERGIQELQQVGKDLLSKFLKVEEGRQFLAEQAKKVINIDACRQGIENVRSRLQELKDGIDKYKHSWSHMWRNVLSVVTFGLYENKGLSSLKEMQRRAERFVSEINKLYEGVTDGRQLGGIAQRWISDRMEKVTKDLSGNQSPPQ
ncbi:MAG: hypothetical protein LBL17_00710 [Coxiellaceae bacterium]|nr:hypothetical protein [Coxiellaceae bacterium]